MRIPTASLDRFRRWIPGLWAGVLLAVAGLAAPAAFSTLDRPLAGLVVGWIFPREAWLSVLLGVMLLLLERRSARGAVQAGRSVLSTEMLLVLGALFCTVAGYFGLQPMMAQARAGQGPYTFGQLHLASTMFYAVKSLAVLALAWRATAWREVPGVGG